MENEENIPSQSEIEAEPPDIFQKTGQEEQPGEGPPVSAGAQEEPPPVAGAAEPPGAQNDHGLTDKVSRILDINVPVTVSFGSVYKPLGEILQYASGSVIHLDRPAQEPVVLKVNGKVFARGEVVEVGRHYGVRISEIISTAQRIASLGESS